MKIVALARFWALVAFWCLSGALVLSAELPAADGYRGIWYSNQRQGDEYVFKYSGGLGTRSTAPSSQRFDRPLPVTIAWTSGRGTP